MNKIATSLLIGLLSITVNGDDITDADIAYDKNEFNKAFKLYNQACDSGVAYGCTMVGALYVDGDGVEKNNQKALSYYSKACDMGYEHACESHTKLQAKQSVCTNDELTFLDHNRYFLTGYTNGSSGVFADSKTIIIDKKNKIIKVWIVNIANNEGRQQTIKAFGEYDDYSNYGYSKTFIIFDYGRRREKTEPYIRYECDGNAFKRATYQPTWDDIIPGSIMEVIMESIMKKYNLK